MPDRGRGNGSAASEPRCPRVPRQGTAKRRTRSISPGSRRPSAALDAPSRSPLGQAPSATQASRVACGALERLTAFACDAAPLPTDPVERRIEGPWRIQESFPQRRNLKRGGEGRNALVHADSGCRSQLRQGGRAPLRIDCAAPAAKPVASFPSSVFSTASARTRTWPA